MLDRSTLSDWVGRACWWLKPLYELVVSTVLRAGTIFADDTTLPVLDPGRGKTKTGRLWCYAVDNRPWAGPAHPGSAYVYSEDRRSEHPASHLANFKGVLQVDGYSGFRSLVEARHDATVRLAFCWAELAKVPPAEPVECQRRDTHGGRFMNSTLPQNPRSRPRCWHGSASSMRLKARSAVNLPKHVGPHASNAAGQLSKHCSHGCRTKPLASRVDHH